MIHSTYKQGYLDALEKVASTSFSRWFAKNSTKFSDKADDYQSAYGYVDKKSKQLTVTPKEIAKHEYEIAKANSGNTGRDAFRSNNGRSSRGSRGELNFPMSAGDALGNQMQLRSPRRKGDYASDIRSNKIVTFARTKGNKDNKGRSKDTIASNPLVRQNSIRRENRNYRGVGDLGYGSPSEFEERARGVKRVYALDPLTVAKKKFYHEQYMKDPANKKRVQDYGKDYRTRDYVQDKRELLVQTPEYKATRKKYRDDPENKAKLKKRNAEYGARPESKAARNIRASKPENLAKKRELHAKRKLEDPAYAKKFKDKAKAYTLSPAQRDAKNAARRNRRQIARDKALLENPKPIGPKQKAPKKVYEVNREQERLRGSLKEKFKSFQNPNLFSKKDPNKEIDDLIDRRDAYWNLIKKGDK